ncbi:MAG: hypothetical protein FJ405_12255 [Verrucomicrobia bacterium]|nr:hypothetical protein [Verrucomicrobiota bacterium]
MKTCLTASAAAKCRSAHGFSLIDSMITMALLGITITSIYAGVGFSNTLIASTRENLRASQILVEKMETIRLYTFSQITSNGFIPLSFTTSFYPTDTNSRPTYAGSIQITNSPLATSYNADTRMVTVTLNWTSGNRPQTRSISTLVSLNGLQSYVY